MSDLLAAARLGNYPTCEKLLISAKVKKSGIKFPRYVLSIINSADNLGCSWQGHFMYWSRPPMFQC